MWLDVAAFENACQQLQDVPRHEVTNSKAEVLKTAVELYRGDLLEGWYKDWCLFERERLQNLYLLILDKLMAYSEDRHQYEAGLEFGERILRADRAHERTYQVMMRLHHLAGDRAGAVRLYQRCAVALQEELGVKPGRHTMQILEQIRGDCVPVSHLPDAMEVQSESLVEPTITNLLACLRQVLSVLNDAQSHIEKDIQAVEHIVPRQFPVLRKRSVNE
jgi:DNA-binding SARP family transcriptional activator